MKAAVSPLRLGAVVDCASSVLEPNELIGFYAADRSPSHSAMMAACGRLCPMLACALTSDLVLKIP